LPLTRQGATGGKPPATIRPGFGFGGRRVPHVAPRRLSGARACRSRHRGRDVATMDSLQLISPTPEFADSYLDMCREEIADDARLSGILPTTLDELLPVLQRWTEQARAGDESTGGVPQSTYWLVRNGTEVLGSSALRHRLPISLPDVAGQIDYGLRPSARGRGYGTVLLALTLGKARELGLREVLVTCRKSNIASMRVIERNGGVPLGELTRPSDGEPLLRYRIEL